MALLILLCFGSATVTEAESQENIPDYIIPEVVVTATKTEIDKKSLTSSVEVISREEIEARGAHTLGEAINSAVGLSSIRSTGRSAISIRGFESRFSLILIDGKRLASEVDQNYELDRISLENVERIEIVRGPVSSMYGTDGMGGVVNIITRRPTKRRLTFGMDYGTHRNQYDFNYDSGLSGKIGFTISGSWLENTSQLKDTGLTYTPFGNRQNLSTKLDYKLSATETLGLSASYLKEDTHEYALRQRPTPNSPLKVNSHDDNERYEVSLDYNYRKQGKHFLARLYTSDYYKRVDVRNLSNNALMNFADSHRTIWGMESRYSFAAGEDHLLTVGGEFRPESFRGTAVRTGQHEYTARYENLTNPGSGIDINYAALYVQDEWQISPKLMAIASLRYDGSSKFNSNVSPKVGFTYKAQPDLRFKLNLGQGFRTPTPNHLYIYSTVVRNGKQVTLVGNSSLQPETSDSYELSVEKDWGRSTGKLTYFNNKVDNLIEEVYASTSLIEYKNIGKATLQGFEAEIAYPVGKNWVLSGAYTYLDATNDSTGNRLFNRPRQKFSPRLTFNDKNNWRFSIWGDLMSDYLYESSPNIGVSKSYMLWNISGEKIIGPNTRLLLGIQNLFNTRDDDMGISGMYFHGGIKFTF
jgi:outer membrane receptor for ferrienterochelin and colicins